MSTYSTEKYDELIREFKQIIYDGAQCVKSHPCSQLVTEIGDFKQTIDRVVQNVEWKDECGEAYKAGLESLSGSLDALSTDVSTNFTKGENLYTDTKTEMDKLVTQVTLFATLISAEPSSTDTKYTKVGATANYAVDHAAWVTKADTMQTTCDGYYETIVDNIDAMNALTVTGVGDITLKGLGLSGVIDLARIYDTYSDTPHSGFDGETTFGLTTDNHDYNGVMTDKQLNILMAIVAGEAYTPSPDDCLAVVSTILNRTDLAAFTHGEPYGNPYDIATARQQFTAYRYYYKGGGYKEGGYKKFLDSSGNFTGPETVRQAVQDGLNGVRNTNALYYLANFCTYNGDNMASPKGNRFQYNPNRKKHG